jgi:hypothetical protein
MAITPSVAVGARLNGRSTTVSADVPDAGGKQATHVLFNDAKIIQPLFCPCAEASPGQQPDVSALHARIQRDAERTNGEEMKAAARERANNVLIRRLSLLWAASTSRESVGRRQAWRELVAAHASG